MHHFAFKNINYLLLFAAIALVTLLSACSTSAKVTTQPTTATTTKAMTSSVSQKRDPSRIYGDASLNQAFADWSEAGYPIPEGARSYDLEGKASWYGPGLNGNKTANGETFDMYGMSAAHKKLPFGTIVLVTNENNGKSVVVRINDRGPFIQGRIIDLSYGAAYLIDMIQSGVVPVHIDVIQLGKKKK